MSNDATSASGPTVPNDATQFPVGPRPFSGISRAIDSAARKQSRRTTNQDDAAPEPEPAATAEPNRTGVESGKEIDSQLIDQTKSQIRTLVQEIAELAQSDCSAEQFFEGFLTRTTNALASQGGAVWLRDSAADPLKLQYHINLKQTVLATDPQAQSQHSKLLQRLLDQAEPSLISPNSGSDDPQQPGNPTDSLLVVGPLIIDREPVGLVEVLQRPNAGPTTQRGYLRFVTQMSEIASDFLRNHRIRDFARQQAMWQQLEQFIRSVHQGLDPQQTIYTIANEGRRLTGTDRLSVAIGTGRNCRVEAVSGLDSIERRADQVKKLGALAATVIRAGEPLWYNGNDAELPPQIEQRLHAYVDKSHSKMLAIIPLREHQVPSADQRHSDRKNKPIGALIIEQLKDSEISAALRQRTEVLVVHSETALTNALDHHSIFLMPLWKLLGSIASAFGSGQLAKTASLIGCVAGFAAFLALFPYPFGLGANGSLVPETEHAVFAQINGVLEQIAVSDSGENLVSKGSLLAIMSNNDLQVEIENLRGQIDEAKGKRQRNQILQSKRLEPADAAFVAGEIATAEQTILSLSRELALKEADAELLNVRSPADGQVINWQVRQNLLRRPVLRGQNLMTIVDPNTQWQIELELPERRLAHLFQAQIENQEPLQVTFGLVSHPGVEFVGEVLYVDQQLNVHSDEGNTALVRVKFPNDEVSPELLRAGTRVTAKIHCGTRPIGYVMFHELFETVQSSFLFWL